MEKRPIYIYDIPPEILNSLSLREATADTSPAGPSKSKANLDAPAEQERRKPPSPGRHSACSLCSLSFESVQDWRGHQKSDLHHYNLKQKLRGLKPVTEADFERLMGDLDESLSGSASSESDDDDDVDDTTSTVADGSENKRETKLSALFDKQAYIAGKSKDLLSKAVVQEDEETKEPRRGGSPLIYISSPLLPPNMYYGIYKAIFTGAQAEDKRGVIEVLKAKQLEALSIPKPGKDGSLPQIAYKGPHIFLCMIGGGHFAAMVVSLAPKQAKHGPGPMNREATVLAHKTFHRYTTRRKQGGAQSTNDNAKGTAHSAGSGLRRANEVMLTDDVRSLLQDWKGLIDTSELLFVRATGVTNRRTIFGQYEGRILDPADPRIRGFPFSTRRATQKELMRAFIQLTRLRVEEIEPVEPEPDHIAAAAAKPSTPAKASKPALTEEEETARLHTSQLQAMIRRSKVPALLSYLKTNGLGADFAFQPAEQHYHAPTPLHLAASHNAAVVVTGLLGPRAGADPTTVNSEGKTPFELAGDRPTRDAFRVARAEAEAEAEVGSGGTGDRGWDWDKARVPAPLSRAEAEKRAERDKKEAEARGVERRKEMMDALGHADGGGDGSALSAKKGTGVLRAVDSLKTPQDRREEEVRGLTPEMRMRLERERRARAAEERIRKMKEGS